MKRVVITGLGAITPIGNNVATYWNNLLSGVSGANIITRFDAAPFRTRFACEVKSFDPLDHFDKKEARKLDLFAQFGLVAAEEAVSDARIPFASFDPERMGVLWSSGIGGFETFEQEMEAFTREGVPRFSPFFITKIIANAVAGHISIRHGMKGINSCTVTACASSTQGLIHAFNYIRWGKADLFITGGAEAPITRSSIGGFNSMKALSANNEEFATASRPFDPSRDGFVVGEGAGALVVESLDSALKRGAPIYGEIVGAGERADAYHITGTHPEGEGAFLAMREALHEAEIAPGDVGYLNAHATSTGIGDISEAIAISRLFGEDLSGLHISATKSMTGHLLGAAGAIEAIATTLALKHDSIPPTANSRSVDEAISGSLNLCLGGSVGKAMDYAMSNSFGFGGHCAAVVIKKYTA